jgi:predicted ATPase
LLFRQGVPPRATYLFKHALVQDAAYGTLLREPRRALHARIADTLESQFAEIAENQPELLARHCSEAGLIEQAAAFWGKAGQRSLTRSALVEATEQLKRALAQIASLPATPTLRRAELELQVALITPLIHVKGYAAPETKAATERAHLLLQQAKAFGEAPEDPLLLFAVLYGFWVANYVQFNGQMMRELAAQFLALAQKHGATVPIMIGHRIWAVSLLMTGDIAESRAHTDTGLGLYAPADHRVLAARFGGHDPGVAFFSYRSFALWLLGYPDAALSDSHEALTAAREIGQAATSMYALCHALIPTILCGDLGAAARQTQELLALADEKSAPHWKAQGTMTQGWLEALTEKTSSAPSLISAGIAAYRSAGSTHWLPLRFTHLATAHAEFGHFDDAWRSIGEAIMIVEKTKERWCEAEVHRVAGELALMSPKPDASKAEAYFERALAVARAQQAKSWELRAAMSMARLWCDQGKREDARNLLAPVYGWFTEGFDTQDLKEAKALLDELA